MFCWLMDVVDAALKRFRHPAPSEKPDFVKALQRFRHTGRPSKPTAFSVSLIPQSRRLDGLLREFLEAAALRSEHWHRRNETASLSRFRSVLAKRNEA
jgi:hypothetical protein